MKSAKSNSSLLKSLLDVLVASFAKAMKKVDSCLQKLTVPGKAPKL